MKLTVLERIMLLNILPNEGNFVTLKIVRQLQEALSFSESEIKAWGITQVDEQVSWDANGESDVAIGEKATDIIVSTLKKLDEDSTLKPSLMSIYEKFVVNVGAL